MGILSLAPVVRAFPETVTVWFGEPNKKIYDSITTHISGFLSFILYDIYFLNCYFI